MKPSRGIGEELVVEAKAHGALLGGFVGLLWLIHIVNALVFRGSLFLFGVHPRSLWGLVGILFAPFLHANFVHLIANTVPLLVLGFFVMLRRKRDLLTVSVLSALVGGLGTWLIGPAYSVHAGASVLVFGYLGYLLARGLFEKRFWSLVGSAIVLFIYGGALWGVLPGTAGISWQGHLFGFLGGLLAARLLAAPQTKQPEVEAARRIAEPAPQTRLALPEDREAEIDSELEELRRRVGR